jgi:deoxyribodipyrimidine photo-lyase
MTGPGPILVWLRDDLRLADNPALHAAGESGRPVAVLFLLDEESPGLRPYGGAQRWWLHHTLAALARSLEEIGGRLILRRGPAATLVPALAAEIAASAVHWNRRYGPASSVDLAVEAALARGGIAARTFKASLLFEPDEIRNKSGEPFRVFTAFWRAALAAPEPRAPLPAPSRLSPLPHSPASDPLAAWSLPPAAPDWAAGFRDHWVPGEAGAASQLRAFAADGLAGYADRRDRPALAATSRLSPHLRFGEVSPFQVWDRLRRLPPSEDSGKFRSELGWREFAWHLLDAFPDLATRNFKPDFDRFPWRAPDPAALAAWRRGQTGYPIVDAGMRQLWQTGWMHNRVRMIVASFLTKHLLVDWRVGEAWFWDTLLDADPASNPFGWQWVAGSGADAQPYFRIFNPVLQGEKFDPDGAYVRRFVPELAALPDRFIHRPFDASPLELAAAGLHLGTDYPAPIVDHAAARAGALAAFAEVSGRGRS